MARTKKEPAPKEEIRIREDDREEFFRANRGGEVLPSELNVSVKDGFRFGIGFILANLIFYTVLVVGVIILVKIFPVIHLS